MTFASRYEAPRDKSSDIETRPKGPTPNPQSKSSIFDSCAFVKTRKAISVSVE